MARRKIYSDRFNKTYKTYRKRYFKKKRQFQKLNRKLIRKGELEEGESRYRMREGVMTKRDFYSVYQAYKDELKDEGIKNPNVVQYIVSDQAYSRSRKQFRGLKARQEELASEVGIDISEIKEIDFRTGNFEIDWDALRNEYHYLRDQFGYTAEEARAEISHYFGSE